MQYRVTLNLLRFFVYFFFFLQQKKRRNDHHEWPISDDRDREFHVCMHNDVDHQKITQERHGRLQMHFEEQHWRCWRHHSPIWWVQSEFLTAQPSLWWCLFDCSSAAMHEQSWYAEEKSINRWFSIGIFFPLCNFLSIIVDPRRPISLFRLTFGNYVFRTLTLCSEPKHAWKVLSRSLSFFNFTIHALEY